MFGRLGFRSGSRVLLLLLFVATISGLRASELLEGQARRLMAEEAETMALRDEALNAREAWDAARMDGKEGELAELRQRFDEISSRYFEQYDELSRGKNEYMLELARQDLSALLAEIKAEGQAATTLRLGIEELEEGLRSYYRVRHREGVHFLDSARTGALRGCYATVERLAVEVERLGKEQPTWMGRLSALCKGCWERIRHVARMGRILLEGAPALVETARALFDDTGRRDLGRAIMTMYAELGKAAGLKAVAEHRGQLDPGRPVLYALTHRHYMGDHMAAFGALGAQEATIVADAAGYGMPRALRRALNRNEGIAPVGHPKIDPVERIVGGLEKTGVVLIYPEGSTATPLGETRPIRPNFEARLLPRLLETGPFQIVPVTIDDVALRFGEAFHGMKWEKEVRVVFHEPIMSEEIARDHAIDPRTELTARRIRLAWHEVLGGREAPAGQLSFRSFEERIRARTRPVAPSRAEASLLPGFEELEQGEAKPLPKSSPRSLSDSFLPFSSSQRRLLSRLFREQLRLRVEGHEEAEAMLALVEELDGRVRRGESFSETELRSRLEGMACMKGRELTAFWTADPLHEPTREARARRWTRQNRAAMR